MKPLSIAKADYVSDYKITLSFSDGTVRTVDFNKFLSIHSHPQYNKYKALPMFRKFKIVMGNIVWGKDWDLIFPIYQLYKGKIGGR